MTGKIGMINLISNSNPSTLRVAKGFDSDPSGKSAGAAKGPFTGRKPGSRSVHFSIAAQILEARERQAALRAERMEFARQMEGAREAADAQAEYLRLLMLAMQIAARITRGDNVPQSDKDFLLEQSPGMYMLAMASRNHHNEDPKDHEALARDEGTSNAAAGVFGQAQVSIPDMAAT